MKLYYVPNTRSHRCRWLLEELEVPYELKKLDVGSREHKQAEYLKLNPHGAVPTLIDGETVVFESGAICLYLADRFPERGLAPKVGDPARGAYYQWLVYSISELEPPVALFFAHSVRLPEPERVPAIVDYAKVRWNRAAKVLDEALAGREYIAGSTFTAADVMIGAVLGWAGMMGLLTDFPGLKAYSKRLASRPAALRARAD